MMNGCLILSTLVLLACIGASHAKGVAVPISTTVTTTTEYDSLFGIHQRRIVPCTASSLSILRGGAEGEDAVKTVYTPASVEELDALLLKAGSEQQLVVIDFTASWCGPCQTIAPIVRCEFSAKGNECLVFHRRLTA
jgi:thioredoxin 1